jgi:ribosomal protein S18 acetylase RimI-like enzyme
MTYNINLSYRSAQVQVTVWEDESTGSVASLWADHKRRGHASQLMKRLIKIADQMKLDLILEVSAYGTNNDPNNDQLTSFYKKFGFRTTGDGVMERKAK